MAYKKVQGIYRIINTKTGFCYIGSTTDIRKRFATHKNQLCKNIHHNSLLQNEYNEFGKCVFDYEVVIIVKNKKYLKMLEHTLINRTSKTYNIGKFNNDNLSENPNKKEIIKKISKGVQKTLKHMTEDERKEKWSKSGHKNPNWKGGKILCPICKKVFVSRHNKLGCVDCYRKNREGKNNPFYGKTHSKETRKKISKKMIGKLPSNSVKVKIGDIIYESNTQAAKAVGCSVASIANRCRNDKFPEYSFITDDL